MINMKSIKSIIAVAVIVEAVVLSLFLVIKLTAITVVAFIFANVGIFLFCVGMLRMLISMESYPWFLAFPMRIWQYFIAQFVLSAVFVAWEQLFEPVPSIRWMILLHILVLVVFAVPLFFMKKGKDIIDSRDDEVKQKVAAQRFMLVDMESLIGRYPQYSNDLRSVATALRYSDPMSHPSTAVLEEQIQRGILTMDTMDEEEKIPEHCAELLRQIADRNARIKMMK